VLCRSRSGRSAGRPYIWLVHVWLCTSFILVSFMVTKVICYASPAPVPCTRLGFANSGQALVPRSYPCFCDVDYLKALLSDAHHRDCSCSAK
jgi:hypothetical protein